MGVLVSIATGTARLAEELQLWATDEFGYVSLADEHCRASVIMPNKKNPYALSFIRGQARELDGTLMSVIATNQTPSGQIDNRNTSYEALPRGLEVVDGLVRLLGEVLERMTLDVGRLREQAPARPHLRHRARRPPAPARTRRRAHRARDRRRDHQRPGRTGGEAVPGGPRRGVHGGGRSAVEGRRRRAVARGAAGAGRREPARHRVLRAGDGARHGLRPAGGGGCAVRRRGRRGHGLGVPGDAAKGRRRLPRANLVGGGTRALTARSPFQGDFAGRASEPQGFALGW